ncbi:GRRM system radical SAM/SPASM domain protein [Aphanothece hegewaldii CCALA 016]|uniref:GRRM system radical SAM/SPASM domain protein n=1 Tax=Aphanothece hegewaldii CCALA 016 TaxID=2107694 RepID=A0A2T1LXR7_9CHRO|nr:cyclophane-forming radical SAM/SPASM peptide maturase GrrM/OscB [Aphanothece hegewaldii]PSF37169.1 GRRM system radical SAM/SPASM domain protein [Aphanothece hegewaldii CCALA 016]
MSKPVLNWSDFGPIALVVVQPTSFCNLNCDYCYLPDRHLKNTLSLELIEPIFKAIFTSRFLEDDFTICWHAGEPLAVPVNFYESAFALIESMSHQYNTKGYGFCHSVQTNATLINDAWCDLFKKHSVYVGVSIDGPAFLHDAHRKTRKGLGSHGSTLRGISFLQKHEIDVHAIAVLTEDSLNYPDEIFNFFWENGITDVGFNMEESEGVHPISSLNQSGIEQRYRAFMARFWELVTATEGKFKLREFETLCSLIYADDRLNHTDMNRPFMIINIDHQGNFSTFDPELLSVKTETYGDFIFGNVLSSSFESACYTEKFWRVYQDMQAGVIACRETCPYFGVCGGGAGSNKYWENGTFRSTQTNACLYRVKCVTDLILDRLETLLLNEPVS